MMVGAEGKMEGLDKEERSRGSKEVSLS